MKDSEIINTALKSGMKPYYIYGKKVDGERYQLVDANYRILIEDGTYAPCFERRKVRSTMIFNSSNAERLCYELEKDFPGYVFEKRKAA